MTESAFTERVVRLRDGWVAYRESTSLAQHHDFDSQCQLLALAYEWAAEAVMAIQQVYSDGLHISLGPLEASSELPPAFRVEVNHGYALTVALRERSRETGAYCSISAAIRLPERDGHLNSVAPTRSGRWTRERVEDLLLALVSACERGRSGGGTAEMHRPLPR